MHAVNALIESPGRVVVESPNRVKCGNGLGIAVQGRSINESLNSLDGDGVRVPGNLAAVVSFIRRQSVGSDWGFSWLWDGRVWHGMPGIPALEFSGWQLTEGVGGFDMAWGGYSYVATRSQVRPIY